MVSISLKTTCLSIRQRWIFAFMCFLGLFNAYTTRSCLPITLTEMIVIPKKSIDILNDNNCESTSISNITNNYNANNTSLRKHYSWDEETQGLILSSYFWVYVITHLPGGIIAEKYGGKHTLGFGILLSAIFTLLTPLSISYGDANGLIISRIFIGLGHGVVYPAINVLLSKWAPPSERSRMGSFVYAATSLGTVFANSISGLIIHHTGQVDYVFYIFGWMSILWYLFWLIMCYNSPQEHPFISSAELKHLNHRINYDSRTKKKLSAIPWRHILYSKAMWAAMLASVGFDWISVIVATDLPKYVSSVLKIPVKENGYLNSLLFVSMSLGSGITSWLADYAIKMKYITITNARKCGSTLSLFCSACFVVAASYVGCNHLNVAIMFNLAMAFNGAGLSSIVINTLDISPNYSGTITAITNSLSTLLSATVAPYIVGIMTTNQTIDEWRIMFWMIFVIAVVTNIVFLMYGSGEIEFWDYPEFTFAEAKRKMAVKEMKKQVSVDSNKSPGFNVRQVCR